MRDQLATLFRLHNTSRDGGFAYPAEYLVAVGRRLAGQGRERSAM